MLVRPPECPNGFIYVHSMFLLILPSRTFAASARRDKYVGIREHLSLESLRKREIEMTQGQVMAQKVVIGKSLPDLKPIEYCGNDEKPVQRHMIVEFVQAKRSGVRQ